MSSVDPVCPDKFYKYKSLTTDLDMERIYKTVTKGEIYFSPARLLNDPFELRPVFSLDASPETHRADYIRMARKFQPWFSDMEHEVEADRAMVSMGAENIKTTTAAIQVLHATFLTQRIGVLCVTTKPDNLLMWSHYAESHKGICLEFDGYSTAMAQAQQVTYTEERLPINPYEDTEEMMMVKGLLTKSGHWSYEDEWRICRYEKGPGLVTISPEAVTGVIVGALASRPTVEWALKMARERNGSLKVSRATISPRKFALEIRPLRVS